MSNIAKVKADYARIAPAYDAGVPEAPSGILESQLVQLAIGDATGSLVLDLGGGGGFHAADALDAGAKRIDLVDISPEMIAIAKKAAQASGREDRMCYYEANASEPLDSLPLEKGGYDLVMANWLFDHAGTMEILEGMLRNISAYLKPGGRFVGIRVVNPHSPALLNEKYGITIRDMKRIPNGYAYDVVMHSDPPVVFESTIMEAICSPGYEMYERFGLTEVQAIPLEKAKIVRSNKELFEQMLQHPGFTVIQAVKKY